MMFWASGTPKNALPGHSRRSTESVSARTNTLPRQNTGSAKKRRRGQKRDKTREREQQDQTDTSKQSEQDGASKAESLGASSSIGRPSNKHLSGQELRLGREGEGGEVAVAGGGLVPPRTPKNGFLVNKSTGWS